jgi:hypothetical protein
MTDTPEDIRRKIADLASLTSECQQLRLSRLTSKQQTGTEQQTTPQLRLQG